MSYLLMGNKKIIKVIVVNIRIFLIHVRVYVLHVRNVKAPQYIRYLVIFYKRNRAVVVVIVW